MFVYGLNDDKSFKKAFGSITYEKYTKVGGVLLEIYTSEVKTPDGIDQVIAWGKHSEGIAFAKATVEGCGYIGRCEAVSDVLLALGIVSKEEHYNETGTCYTNAAWFNDAQWVVALL